ncbi:MAG: amino acid ABC transporter permease, partial [Pseudomonadota bacterium]|nr:amino acid ABC transporter permease [Pseudomonadota bacterium]
YANYFADKTFNPFISYPILAFYFILLSLAIIFLYGRVYRHLNRHLPQARKPRLRPRPQLMR